MSSVLMVAEKPSLAESLAKILSHGRCRSRKGVSSACPIHEYRGRFHRESDVLFKFTSVCGHLTSVDFPPKYNNWDRTDPYEVCLSFVTRFIDNLIRDSYSMRKSSKKKPHQTSGYTNISRLKPEDVDI